MAGLDPDILLFASIEKEDMDARDKPGHDEVDGGPRQNPDLSKFFPARLPLSLAFVFRCDLIKSESEIAEAKAS